MEEDFAAFMMSRQSRLLRLAWLLTSDWGAAEDAVQVALTRAWRHWHRVSAADDPDAYVRRMLINAVATSGRGSWFRLRRVPAMAEPVAPQSGPEIDVTERLVVQRALGRLTQRQRAMLVLRYFDDLSEAQVAEVMRCAVGTVKSTTAKALGRLRLDTDLLDLLERVEQ